MNKFLFIAILLMSAPALRADPTGKVVGSGSGVITGFREEPNTFEIDTDEAKFKVIVEASAREARKQIHAERSKQLFQGKSLAEVQKKQDKGQSVYIGLNEDGGLVGIFKNASSDKYAGYKTVPPIDLREGGATKTVVLSGGKRKNKPAVFVRLLDGSGVEKKWLILTYIDSESISMDFEVKGNPAGGGGPNSGHIDVYPDDEPAATNPNSGAQGHIDVYPDEQPAAPKKRRFAPSRL